MSSATVLTIRQLLATPAVTAEVGQKVYPTKVPQGTDLPYLAVTVLSEGDAMRHLGGAGGSFDARVEIAAIAGDATSADLLAEIVKAAFGDLLHVAVLDPSTSPPELLGTIVQTDKAGAELFDWSDDGKLCRRISDYNIRWRP